MTIDMSQFYQVFFEETAEHLNSMETLLLALDPRNPGAEELNAVFRAAHSIKGSAATFGFDDLAAVTHILENLLDRVRKGELQLREDMVDAFLDAGDVLGSLLAAHRGGAAADPEAAQAVCRRLQQLTETGVTAMTSSLAPTMPTPAANAKGAVIYSVRFLPSLRDVSSLAADLGTELAQFGRVLALQAPPANAPNAPWLLNLETTAERQTIVDCLAFVAQSDSLRIETLGESPGIGHGDPEGAYGFFDEPDAGAAVARPGDDPDGAFGFFDDVAVTTGDDPGGAYGFFDAPASAPAADPTAGAATMPAAEPYGFFAPQPAADGAYGFFEPLAVPLPVHVEAPSASMSTPPFAAALAPTHAAADATASAPPLARTPSAAGKAGVDSSIRVSVEKVDQMINLVGELVITQAMLAQAAEGVDPVVFERLLAGIAQLERNTRDIQEAVMSVRMMPISVVFARFPRVVRDTSHKLGKRVELRMIGEHTELDRGLIERIADPLTHLIRNSLDHGIEAPEARLAKGKPEFGTITLKAYHKSGNVVIEVGDDGNGLDRARILAKARERGMNVADSMTDADVWALIFEPGFSTAEQITEVSGRGVGMDVVRRNITAMGGRVDIESMSGIGTRMTVRLPLTLAILDAMSVAVGGETYLIPLAYVVESLQPARAMVKSVSGVERLLQVRDDYLPVIVLHEAFGVAGAIGDFERGIMVVLESDGSRVALFVDAMIGQHQVVIKSLEANYRKIAGISGATIMGDGRVAMIIDVAGLANLARSSLPAAA